jgi:hypothetical protein
VSHKRQASLSKVFSHSEINVQISDGIKHTNRFVGFHLITVETKTQVDKLFCSHYLYCSKQRSPPEHENKTFVLLLLRHVICEHISFKPVLHILNSSYSSCLHAIKMRQSITFSINFVGKTVPGPLGYSNNR